MVGQGPNSNRYDSYRGRGPSRNFTYMLDMSRLTYFRYDAKEILKESSVKQNVWEPMLSSIVAKSSRTSIAAALEYVEQKRAEGILPDTTARQLSNLLDRYKRSR